ncbi:MAG TPA: protein translocase subunit SecF [Candidatus Dormibacteraeota bacterium]|nr:protein translocase subunit SecF [Candidatus Dormibacteraeota bacterium]
MQEPSDEKLAPVSEDEPGTEPGDSYEGEYADEAALEEVEAVEEAVAPVGPVKEPEPPRVRRLDLVSRRNIFFFISLLIIVPGIISMSTKHFLLGIDFAGGTETTISVRQGVTVADVQRAVDAENVEGSVIPAGNGYIIRTPVLSQDRQNQMQADLNKSLGAKVESVLEVCGTIAGETVEFALLAVVLASVAILLLLAIRFRNVPGGWRAGFQFGGSALAALLHDVFVLTGLFSIFGTVLHWQVGEINAFFVTAVLTVVGFSVHDTIVVFDRIRENLRVSQRLSFEQVVNLSIMQTAARSIITSFTVVLVLAAIFISGGPTLQGLALALLIGIVSGTYSSIFNAAPLLVVWRRLQPLR